VHFHIADEAESRHCRSFSESEASTVSSGSTTISLLNCMKLIL
jgi:hypothetical protein